MSGKNNTMNVSLKSQLSKDFSEMQLFSENFHPKEDILKIDLHCHDYNSDVPDEILGRILNVPETWLETEKLFDFLKQNEVDAYTITNHNNARSCYKMQEAGFDVLTAAEFSCNVPDFGVGIHVLTYGFSKEQEKELQRLRKNLYAFLEYSKKNNIPTIWAHPLYYYSAEIPPIEFFEKISLVFERFEVLNGQRDIWQNMLTVEWINQLTPERIDILAKKHMVDMYKYCTSPYEKALSGGSDSHIGLFAGETGTSLYVPNLSERLKTNSASELALEAIREKRMNPYGQANSSERLTISLLDYVCQVAKNISDPGLLRILLHKGTVNDKILALTISNAFLELKHHKVTMKFIELFHNSLMGKKPKLVKGWFVSKNYKPVFNDAILLAVISRKKDKINKVRDLQLTMNSMHSSLSELLYSRLNKKLQTVFSKNSMEKIDLNNILNKIEIPGELRSLLGSQEVKKKNHEKNEITDFLDGLSFPFLASGVILAAHFTSAKVLYNNRKLLNQFSQKLGKYKHPKKVLWLTDTYSDKNGVSLFLQSMHREIKDRNLPVDILVCSNKVEPDDHLIVVDPLMEYTLPMYQEQTICVPDFLKIHQLFQKNEYDRIICSTEGVMGLAALYLKHAFSVEASFYMHTDWITFVRTTMKIDRSNLNRFRRILRAYYKGFDNIFVLNTDQQNWLTGREMNIDQEKVHLTAHWTESKFYPRENNKEQLFGIKNNVPVLLYAGRISLEKGVMEIMEVFSELKHKIKNLKMVFAGDGPALETLKESFPEALYLGWTNHDKLPEIYSSADLLILPSKFDTFSCVVLEAMSCGLPVIAYNSKGPKDIIKDDVCGFLASDTKELKAKAFTYFSNKEIQVRMKEEAILRASDYNSNEIIYRLMNNLNLF